MTQPRRIFRAAYLLAGLACLAVMAVSSRPGLARKFIRADLSLHGDLFDMCKVSAFKVPRNDSSTIRETGDATRGGKESRQHPIVEADVVFTGDSFFNNSFGREFEGLTGVPSHAHWFYGRIDTPPEYLDSIGYRKGKKPSYIVVGYAERSLFPAKFAGAFTRPATQPASKTGVYLKAHMPDVKALEFLVTENPVGCFMVEARNTFRFRLFREITGRTPVYSLRPPILFYDGEVNFNRMKKDGKYVAKLAGTIYDLGVRLQKDYGLRMIFVPVPNKFTIYGYDHDGFDFNHPEEKYDGFLPRLYRELDSRGVQYVDLYHVFMERRGELLYHGTDTHWNRKGVRIAVEKVAELYRPDRNKAGGKNITPVSRGAEAGDQP